jgi:transcriptional regulator with XRE-family HTH domain
MTISPLERATDEFAARLTRLRTERGLSKRALAAAMGFDPSYVSHVEGRRHRPTEDFARRAENVLDSGGAIWEAYTAYESVRESASVGRLPAQRRDIDGWSVPGIGLIVEREDAAIGLRNDRFHIAIRRALHNVGTEPIVRFPVHIRVDRFPAHPRRSARTHHGSPLSWSELGFSARRLAADGSDPDVLTWRASHDSDAVKELWLQFANDDGQFPLYPGQRTTIEYSFHVGTDKWGPWFQRAIRMPTNELRVELDFPADTQVAVWGTVSSLAAEGAPLSTPIQVTQDAERMTFTWSVRAPILGARYRFEWRLRD